MHSIWVDLAANIYELGLCGYEIVAEILLPGLLSCYVC